MNSLRQKLFSVIPRSWKTSWRAALSRKQARRDRERFPAWLSDHCAREKKKAVVVWRVAAIGDIICTLPMLREIRRRHPHALLVYVTACGHEPLVDYSGIPDLVYGATSQFGDAPWIESLPASVLAQIEKIYVPLTTDERAPNTGAKVHLIDDLAASCEIEVTERQPRLEVPHDVLENIRENYELTKKETSGCLVIGINGGHTWPVREWDAPKWQQLVEAIHAEYNAVILQFGSPLLPEIPDPYRHFTGVRNLIGLLPSRDLIGLIAICDLLISIDSGPVHIAGAVGTPVVGLFGAVNPLFRLPPESPGVGLVHEVPCLYCHHETPQGHWRSGCPFDVRCMHGLEVEPVMEAVRAMLLTHAKVAPRSATGG